MAKKATQRFSWDDDHEAGTATVEDRVTKQTVTFKLGDYSDEIYSRLAVYGLKKVLQDRTSDDAAGSKIEAMRQVSSRLAEGHWTAERTAGARLLPAVIEAIAEAKGCSAGAAQAAYRKLPKEAQEAIKTNLAERIAEIEAEREQDIDLSDLK